SKLGDQNAPPLIAGIKTYDDGTILVQIIRNESTQSGDCSKIGRMSLEQKLYIRLIFLNGTVKEIDPNLNLHPINYCLLDINSTKYKINKLDNKVIYLNDTKSNKLRILHNLVNPITIFPLQKPFILVTFVRTNNPSDLTTYEECMRVIDWDGNIRGKKCLDPFDGAWINSTIQLNANKKLGFIRFV
ncbi:297_t:CDS:2, partial [Dentiscutata heterogama]